MTLLAASISRRKLAELQQFWLNPSEKAHNFRVKKERRQHLSTEPQIIKYFSFAYFAWSSKRSFVSPFTKLRFELQKALKLPTYGSVLIRRKSTSHNY
jgi:hypothetical protein